MTPVGHGSALVSWSGSMFEYLMPALVMRSPSGSLLDQTYRLVRPPPDELRRASSGVPWGISESAYNVRDLDLTYQYSNFGVPGLGLERGLSDDLVVAPYATALAAMVEPAAAAGELAAARGRGRARVVRLLRGARLHGIAPARGRDGGHRARLHGAPSGHDPRRAVERAAGGRHARAVPRGAHRSRPPSCCCRSARRGTSPSPGRGSRRSRRPPTPGTSKRRCFASSRLPHDPIRRTHLLSNGRYSVMLTERAAGYSRCGDLEVTRWREDVTRDHWGRYVFVRDVVSGAVWSAGISRRGSSRTRIA